MLDLRRLVTDSHHKIIGHYRKLLETSRSDVDRAFYRAAIQRHEQEMQRLLDEIEEPMRRAA